MPTEALQKIEIRLATIETKIDKLLATVETILTATWQPSEAKHHSETLPT